MIKDYSMTIIIKNNYMLSAMRLVGIETAAGLSRATGLTPTVIGKYLNLKQTPYNAKGNLKISIEKIAKTLKQLPEDLFPPQHLYETLAINKATAEVDMAQIDNVIEARQNPQTILEHADRTNALNTVLKSLTRREELVIRGRFGFDGEVQTLAQIADEFGVGTGRIRQIASKAIRKLRQTTAGRALSDFL